MYQTPAPSGVFDAGGQQLSGGVELAERPAPERVEVIEIVADRLVGDAVIDGQVVVFGSLK